MKFFFDNAFPAKGPSKERHRVLRLLVLMMAGRSAVHSVFSSRPARNYLREARS